MQTNSTEGWYFDIINSNNAIAEFNALSNEEKANFGISNTIYLKKIPNFPMNKCSI
jgi:hypothetical protein